MAAVTATVSIATLYAPTGRDSCRALPVSCWAACCPLRNPSGGDCDPQTAGVRVREGVQPRARPTWPPLRWARPTRADTRLPATHGTGRQCWDSCRERRDGESVRLRPPSREPSPPPGETGTACKD